MKTEEDLLRELRDELARCAASRMTLRRVDAKDYPKVDLEFYERTAARLASCGFTPVGDFEQITGTAGDGAMRCFARCFLAHPEPYTAACYHPRPRFWPGLFSRIISGGIGKIVEVETEFSDDTWVITTTVPKARLFDPPPLYMREHYPQDTPVEQLVATHRRRVQAYAKAHPGATPLKVSSVEGLERSQARQHDIFAVHRQMVGGLTADEIRRFSIFGRARSAEIKQALTDLGEK